MTGSAPQGRPRSEAARLAVLHAVDDLLVDVGYGAMTMKGIAERAGVGRMTVYRWWPTKAHLLVEACAADLPKELAVPDEPDPERQLTGFLTALAAFLTGSDAGAAYRALLGEAQHDPEVGKLVAGADLLGGPAREVLARVRGTLGGVPEDRFAAAELCGPVVLLVMSGSPAPDATALRAHAARLAKAWA
ncbi:MULTISPECIES: TetR/AcrR family transcriptional regulator [Streptomyces]|uniref:TetR/AcrR family transcriptional regulator n=1 Tax=Streptomyces evansiae TaxID=3075535 RepID=A0ABU2QYG2_9ACTN|nr:MULTISPECIES: TetR/AcrR family transcriptional regulator [unclassified Streptomyces]MDT0409083.1 TetR/AcrR family transcriptional regulator [Streptomyces sp. DSM 41979]MYQ59081.1 TetR family transcriptional regulator [Streptomyces sp. SID4926]NJA59331.1 TetR/AcrR family transcriptional regulator [Streptomyces sp. NEAU-H3]WEH25963.1 TetR/AcrR family transcriptional regulator [Streptomyces sp. AM 3-1-1]